MSICKWILNSRMDKDVIGLNVRLVLPVNENCSIQATPIYLYGNSCAPIWRFNIPEIPSHERFYPLPPSEKLFFNLFSPWARCYLTLTIFRLLINLNSNLSTRRIRVRRSDPRLSS